MKSCFIIGAFAAACFGNAAARAENAISAGDLVAALKPPPAAKAPTENLAADDFLEAFQNQMPLMGESAVKPGGKRPGSIVPALAGHFLRTIDVTHSGGQFCDRGDSYVSALFRVGDGQAPRAASLP
jgi:hypothetical protein